MFCSPKEAREIKKTIVSQTAETLPKNNNKIFIIHIYKNMGSTIYSQMPKSYNQKFYGQHTRSSYTASSNIKLNDNIMPYWRDDEKVSIDHVHIDNLLDLGILRNRQVALLQCICIIREPISRFLSMCNFQNQSPQNMIEDIKKMNMNQRRTRNQISMITTKNNWNITLFKMDDISGITEWFAAHNQSIDLTIKHNVSQKKFRLSDICDTDIQYLNEVFKDDINLYNSIPIGGIKGGIVNKNQPPLIPMRFNRSDMLK